MEMAVLLVAGEGMAGMLTAGLTECHAACSFTLSNTTPGRALLLSRSQRRKWKYRKIKELLSSPAVLAQKLSVHL